VGKNMRIIECEQRSSEWYQARVGIPSASEFDKIITTSGLPSTQRNKYLYKLVGEKLGALPEEGFKSKAMEDGILKESEARDMYARDVKPITQCGFCLHDDGYGASPDGLVEEDGQVEIKCPSLAVHVEYLIRKELPTDYFCQTQGQLLVTGRKYNDFISYYPGLKPLVIRVRPDLKFQEMLKVELSEFIKELNELVEKLK
jgi:putative phage-type endonuclease